MLSVRTKCSMYSVSAHARVMLPQMVNRPPVSKPVAAPKPPLELSRRIRVTGSVIRVSDLRRGDAVMITKTRLKCGEAEAEARVVRVERGGTKVNSPWLVWVRYQTHGVDTERILRLLVQERIRRLD